MKLSILIPVYNERYLVGELVRRVLAAPLPEGLEREVVIVDDGSSDGTREILEALARRHSETVVCLFQEKNQGKGAALRRAIAQARGEFCIFQDADLEYDPNDYGKILEPLLSGQADAVYGSRFLPGRRSRVLYFWHSLGNRFLTTLSNLFTNLNLTDMETCYKAFRTQVLKTIPIRNRRFGIEPELTAKIAKRQLRLYEVPINYDGRTYSEGKKVTWKDGLWAFYVIVKYFLVDDLYDERSGRAILARLSRTHRFERWMADKLRPFVRHRVLEIGAGIGNLTGQFLPRDRYIASDSDTRRLEVLRNLLLRRPGLRVARIDPEKAEDFAPFLGTVDTLLCLDVLARIPDDAAALKNFYNVLEPGGRLLLRVPQGPWLYGPLDRTLEHERRYRRRELAEALRAAGFEIERTFQFNKIGMPGWFLNSTLLRRRRLPKIQLRIFDALVWLWRGVDGLCPWPGLFLAVVARRPAEDAPGKAP